ncbi:MAG TPA: hypothetical protein VE870_03680 [Bacteroidales bacterium]|nr:hypothetical protein [Bacteroidales bacterium]
MAILNKSQLIQQGVYYTPNVQQSVGSGATETFTLQGYRGLQYGLNRILIGLDGGNLYDFEVTAKILYNQGTTILFSSITADAIQNMFLARSLRGPFIIDEQTNLEIDVKNTSGTSQVVNVEILGYADVQLQNLRAEYAAQGKALPRPYLLGITITSIPAGTSNKQITVTLPRQFLRLYRMSIGSDAPNSLSVKIRQNTTYIKPQVLASQINEEFKHMDIILPVQLDSRIPFQLFVDNLDTVNAHNISFFAETYMV